MSNKMTLQEVIIISKQAWNRSELSMYILLLHMVFLLGMFIEPISGITGFVVCIALQLANLIIGVQNLELDILRKIGDNQ